LPSCLHSLNDPSKGFGGKKRSEEKDSLWPVSNGLKIACHECHLPGLSTAIEPSQAIDVDKFNLPSIWLANLFIC